MLYDSHICDQGKRNFILVRLDMRDKCVNMKERLEIFVNYVVHRSGKGGLVVERSLLHTPSRVLGAF